MLITHIIHSFLVYILPTINNPKYVIYDIHNILAQLFSLFDLSKILFAKFWRNFKNITPFGFNICEMSIVKDKGFKLLNGEVDHKYGNLCCSFVATYRRIC